MVGECCVRKGRTQEFPRESKGAEGGEQAVGASAPTLERLKVRHCSHNHGEAHPLASAPAQEPPTTRTAAACRAALRFVLSSPWAARGDMCW